MNTSVASAPTATAVPKAAFDWLPLALVPLLALAALPLAFASPLAAGALYVAVALACYGLVTTIKRALSPIEDPGLVVPAIAEALAVPAWQTRWMAALRAAKTSISLWLRVSSPACSTSMVSWSSLPSTNSLSCQRAAAFSSSDGTLGAGSL